MAQLETWDQSGPSENPHLRLVQRARGEIADFREFLEAQPADVLEKSSRVAFVNAVFEFDGVEEAFRRLGTEVQLLHFFSPHRVSLSARPGIFTVASSTRSGEEYTIEMDCDDFEERLEEENGGSMPRQRHIRERLQNLPPMAILDKIEEVLVQSGS